MNIVQQCDRSDKTRYPEISGVSTLTWGSEIIPCGEVKLPDLVRTRGRVAERLAIDPSLVMAFQMKTILVIPIVHLDAPRRQPISGHIHLLDMVQHGRLEYADDGAPMLTFPASVIRYPKKPKTTRRCSARRPKGA